LARTLTAAAFPASMLANVAMAARVAITVSNPDLSVVVIVHDMAREAPRTLLSLSAGYQLDIRPDEYEVIVVDNGSTVPLSQALLDRLPGQFRLIRLDPAPPSPARAINRGLAEARGRVIGVMIDGARMVTPRTLRFALHGATLYPRTVVATLGWYLGYDLQAYAVLAGYDAAQEDALLASVGWPANGYRLFEISTPDESSVDAWLAGPGGTGRIYESNALFATRSMWHELGGAEERFALPGGGLLSFDLFRRAVELPDARLVLLLGEAAFHQVHGGIATNATPAAFRERYQKWAMEYLSIRGKPYAPAQLAHPPACLGTLPHAALARLVRSVIDPVQPATVLQRGASFDLWQWPHPASPPPRDAKSARLLELMRTEFNSGRYDCVAAIARMVRAHSPAEPEPLRLLQLVASYHDERGAPLERDARFHTAIATAHQILGGHAGAASEPQGATSRGLAETASRTQYDERVGMT
jgi:hypothetical protein